jgi:CheY-like chemotaxis protein
MAHPPARGAGTSSSAPGTAFYGCESRTPSNVGLIGAMAGLLDPLIKVGAATEIWKAGRLSHSAAMTGSAAISRFGLSVLIVDDDPSTLQGLMALVGQAGYNARGAASFREGREILDQTDVSLLITDVRLGAANGLHLMLQAQMKNPPTPVIVITGFADAVLEAQARRVGAVFLTKPINVSEFLGVVRQQLLA